MSLFTNEFEQDISRTRFVGWSHPTRLVITALDFHLHFNRSTGDQVWREEPLAYRIFASFVGVGRPGDSMSAQNVPVLPNHDFHDYPKMLIPQRCRPFRTTHLNRPHAYTRYSVTKWADRIGRWSQVQRVRVRDEFDGLDPQLEVRLAAVGDFDFARQVASLELEDVVVNGLNPSVSMTITKDGGSGFKAVLCWITELRVFFHCGALECVPAESALEVPRVEAFERIGVGKWANDFCANPQLCGFGPPLVSSMEETFVGCYLGLIKFPARVNPLVAIRPYPKLLERAAVEIVAITIELVVEDYNMPWPNVARFQAVQQRLLVEPFRQVGRVLWGGHCFVVHQRKSDCCQRRNRDYRVRFWERGDY